MNKAHELLTSFKTRFGTGASVYRAPGRVNLIGEHTDYNDGLVMPAAIGFSCWVAITPRDDRRLILYSENYREAYEANLDELGARVGIMDQFVSCHGRAGHALLIDCRSLEYRSLRLPPKVSLVICNTMVKHKLQASEYNVRRAECEEAVRKLSVALPGIRSLRDVSLEQLAENRRLLSETLYRRCRHVISENTRVRKVADLFGAGKTEGLGEVMAASHESLRDDYEVSCRELDATGEIAGRQPGVYGARMTGGGFGGCTINFVDVEHAGEFRSRVSAEYEAAIGLRPDIYICEASQGAELVEVTAENLPKVAR